MCRQPRGIVSSIRRVTPRSWLFLICFIWWARTRSSRYGLDREIESELRAGFRVREINGRLAER